MVISPTLDFSRAISSSRSSRSRSFKAEAAPSQAKLVAFDNAIKSFTFALQIFNVLELPNDVAGL